MNFTKKKDEKKNIVGMFSLKQTTQVCECSFNHQVTNEKKTIFLSRKNAKEIYSE